MPKKQTLRRARKAKREGKAPSMQAGELVREEIEHVRRGKRGARSTKQAIAIGLSKARREGVKLPPAAKGKTSEETRKKAAADNKRGQSAKKKTTSKVRSRASSKALRREGHQTASKIVVPPRQDYLMARSFELEQDYSDLPRQPSFTYVSACFPSQLEKICESP
jgi:hypothetical protein